MLTDCKKGNTPLVSICLPVYNGEKFLCRALDSLLGQTYENLELIISDNASTDATRRICLEYAAKDKRICYQRNSTNVGYTANLRRALELSSGEYVMWASVDDTKPPDAVQTCLTALLQNHDAVMAHGSILFEIPGQTELLEVANDMDMSNLSPLQRIRVFTTQTKNLCMVYGLYKREAVLRAFYPNSYGQEHLLGLQMSLLGPLVHVKSPMVVYRLRKASLNINPIYDDIPISLANLITARPVFSCKAWAVLVLGSFYLANVKRISLKLKLSAALVHCFWFIKLHKRKLVRETLFLLCLPISYLVSFFWKLAKKSTVTSRLAHNIKERVGARIGI